MYTFPPVRTNTVQVELQATYLRSTLGKDIGSLVGLQSLERLGEQRIGLECGLDGENDIASQVGDSRH